MEIRVFDELLARRLKKISQVLASKNKEYGLNGDRLHNFKIAATMKNITPAQALDGMLLKHRVSVDDMIEGRCEVTQELIDEKIGDHINYLILLEALFTELLQKKQLRT